MVMKYPWVAEAIIEWKINFCRCEGKELFCNECGFYGEICDKLLELAEIIIDKKEDEEGD